jgi:peptide/nickel transport system substrate-binding protein
MRQASEHPHRRGRVVACANWLFVLATAMSAGCGSSPRTAAIAPVALRIGVGNMAPDNPLGGIKVVAANQSFEGLVRIGPDGRPRPWLAKSWRVSDDRRSMVIELRPEARFHDGSPVTASIVVASLRAALPAFLGPVFEDIDNIAASIDSHQIVITFKRPSPFLLESLEATIKKPGAPSIGTGPFALTGPTSSNEMRANADYYLGKPTIDRIVVTSYPSVRSAWAEMLRNNIDMLYEVGADAASSMQEATNVSTFSFVRSYQYVIILNVRAPKFSSPNVRRALNAAINREEVVRDGFDGHATAADGLVWPQNWAFSPTAAKVGFDPQAAAAQLKSAPKISFTCLVPTDYERVALVVQRQLAAVGVTMNVDATTPDRAFQALGNPSFDAVLVDIVDGPSLLRPYEYWHTGGSMNLESISRANFDAALDRIRHAASDDEYRIGVADFQNVTTEDPPAIYLAWGERSRAISKRFDVPVEPGRDVLSTLRLWKPVANERHASRN